MFSHHEIPYIAIDIGSNAIRASLAIFDQSEDLEIIKNYRYPIRLGEDVFSKGKISKKKQVDIEQAFYEIKDIVNEYNVKNIKAVATSALRNATNGPELVDHIKNKFDIQIDLIDGQKEAQYIQMAINSYIDLSGHTALLIDIGGGSTEITVSDNLKTVYSKSFQIGTVRLLNTESKQDLDTEIKDFMEKVFDELKKLKLHDKIDICVGTGGNLKRMGKLRKIFFDRHQHKITQEEIVAVNLEVKKLSLDQRMKMLGMRKDRADVIVPAMNIVESLLIKLNIHEILLPQVGLKEGVFLELIKKKPRKIVFN